MNSEDASANLAEPCAQGSYAHVRSPSMRAVRCAQPGGPVFWGADAQTPAPEVKTPRGRRGDRIQRQIRGWARFPGSGFMFGSAS